MSRSPVNEQKNKRSEETVSGASDGVCACAGGAPLFGGRTTPRQELKGNETRMQTLTVEAKGDSLAQVNDFVDGFLEAADCPMKTQMLIDLCVEEIFVNIANYAYPDGGGSAEVRISEEEGVVTLTFIDSGIPYDPLKKADPDVTLSAEERQIGGLGVFLVKKNMDSVAYRYEDGKNVFTMTKNIVNA